MLLVVLFVGCWRFVTVKLSSRQQKLEKVMDQEGLADEEVRAHPAYTWNKIKHSPAYLLQMLCIKR